MLDAQVVIEGHADERVGDVAAAFERRGISARVRSNIQFNAPPPGAGPEWLVVTVITVAFGAFLSAFAAEAGKDAYAALKQFFGELGQARGVDRGRVIVHDPARRLILYAPPDLPDEGYVKLFTADFSAFKPGTLLGYNEQSGAWEPSGETTIPRPGGTFMWFGPEPEFAFTITDWPGDSDDPSQSDTPPG